MGDFSVNVRCLNITLCGNRRIILKQFFSLAVDQLGKGRKMNTKRRLPIERVISMLGYASSENLKKADKFQDTCFSTQVKKTLSKINPYAAYMVNDAPFVLFFDMSINERDRFKSISKQIWNAQIPVAVFCDENTVKIFNGTSLSISDLTIKQISEYSIDSCSENSDFSFWDISDPLFWEKYAQNYSKGKLNYILLENISYLTNELKNTYHIPFATKLVLRLIFIRYLIDRGIDLDYQNFSGNIQESQEEFLHVIKEKDKLYDLFVHLKEKFNGNLFELDRELESDKLVDKVFNLFAEFFSEKEILYNGQRSLFSLYDFDIIPVELISNMYEILIGKETRDKENAFYTPNYLVEFILDRVVGKSPKDKTCFTVLDPSCGSGVFLVDCYRRIVEKNRHCEDDNLLEQLLVKNIYGIDKSDEAIDVTVFSLYLTLLDYKDPKTLLNFKLPNLKGENLFVGDFFDNKALTPLLQKKIKFDYIVGNPPWGNVKDGLHMSYCREHGHMDRQMSNEISRSFVFRSRDFSSEKTVCCFILHSKLLYNKKKPSVNFRKYLLTETKINTVIELSSVRKILFEGATAPAVIIAFKFCNQDNLNSSFIYTSIKPNLFFKIFHVFIIEKNDIKLIPQFLLLNNDWAWKTIVYGTSFDFETIIKLKRKYLTLKEATESQNPALIMNAGVEYHDGDQQDATHLLGKTLLDSRNGVDHFSVNTYNTTIFDKPRIHRTRDEALFVPPYVLFAKGVDCDNYKIKAAYSEEGVVAKSAMYIIKGAQSQKAFLLNLVGLLNSSLYAYLNLMLGASIGIEREQRFIAELLGFPYIFSDEVVQRVDYIQKKIRKRSQTFPSQCDDIETKINELDKLILRKFELENNVFIDYILNIQIPEINGKNQSMIYRKVSIDDLRKYVECFEMQFSQIYNRQGKYISLNIYPNLGRDYAAFELQIKDDEVFPFVNVLDNCDNDKVLLSKFAVHAYNDKFYQIRDVIYFNRDSFYIIKPNIYKYWHPAMAEIDLAEVMDQILTAQ